MLRRFNYRYVPSPWFSFLVNHDKRCYCQPDAILLKPSGTEVTIIEIKLKHTTQSYFQIENLYRPVLDKFFKYSKIKTATVVRWYDPETEFPEGIKTRLCENLDFVKQNELAVHIWRPKARK